MKNEWRLPLTILIFSSMIFTAFTFGIGFNINRITGELIITMGTNTTDAWSYNPMNTIWSNYWRYYCMLGYYGALAVFSYAWFEYMKTKEVITNGRNKE